MKIRDKSNFVFDQKLSLLIIFTLAFLLFFYLQNSPTFADPDSFYHAKMVILMKEQGVIKDFPWLQFTVLKDYYTDQHFLYHVLLIPFFWFFHPVVALKLATVILASLVITFCAWLFKKFKLKCPFFFSLLLLFINPFIFRVSLAKAPALSLIILILSLAFIFRRRKLALALLSFIYVWSYGGFLLLFIFTAFWGLVNVFKGIWQRKEILKRLKVSLKLFFSSLAGMVVGLILNPYFPKNILFLWQQLVKIGMINYQKVIGVGGEWYPYKFIDLVANTAFLSLVLLVTLVLFFIHFKKQSRKSWTLLLIFAFFFLLTLKSRRYVEYYVPFTLIFCAFSLTNSLANFNLRKISDFIRINFKKYKLLFATLLVYFLVTVPYLAWRDVRQVKNDLKNGLPHDKFYAASRWLAENSPAGALVFHSDWDESPLLFYHNHHNYYIVGLDPTFMYNYNQELYWQWVNITIGKKSDDLHSVIKDNFGASFVFLEKDHVAMDNNLKRDAGFEKVYEDKEAKIYRVL